MIYKEIQNEQEKPEYSPSTAIWTGLIIAAGCTTISTSGDYNLESGETPQGYLLIASGNDMLESGSRVAGDVIMTSRDLFADRQFDDDIIMSSGDANLGLEAIVKRDIEGTSGDVNRVDCQISIR